MKRTCIALVLLFLILYVVPLGVRPLLIPDEVRYAEIPREMLETGDWIVPRLDGLRYFEKPPLGYWLNAAAIYLCGENAFAVRLPSALATGVSALLILLLVRRFGGGYQAGLLAAAAFLTCFEVFAVGVFCVLDSVFSMFVTATMVTFFFAWRKGKSKTRTTFFSLSGVFCGLAFLAKGFLAFVLPVVVIVPFLLWQHRGKDLLRIWWVPLTTAALLALPWCLAIQSREGDFWHYFFWTEHVQRFMSPKGGQHLEPFWFFIPFIMAGGLPWTALCPCAIWGLKRTPFRDPLVRFATCWLLFPLLFFSASRGKLGTYILPCFPPMIILTIVGLLKYFSSGKQKAFKTVIYTSVILLICIAVMLASSQICPFIPFKAYKHTEGWKVVLLVAGLLLYAAFLKRTVTTIDYHKRIVLCCIGPLLLMCSAHFVIPDRLKTGKMPGEFLLSQSRRIRPDTAIISDGGLTPAVCWFYHRDNVYLFGKSGELGYGLSHDDAKYRKIGPAEFWAFIKRNSKGKGMVLITSAKHYDGYKKGLPPPAYEKSMCGFVLAEYMPTITIITKKPRASR